MARTAADYASAMQALMPRGRVWQFQSGSTQAQTTLALSQEWARLDASAASLLAGSLPGDYPDLLAEWEATLGLDGDYSNLTNAQRAAQIKARFIATGGQSRQFLITFASALGFTIEITVYVRCRAGHARAGDPVYGEDWALALGITIIANPGGLPTATLLSELEAIVSAHEVILLL